VHLVEVCIERNLGKDFSVFIQWQQQQQQQPYWFLWWS